MLSRRYCHYLLLLEQVCLAQRIQAVQRVRRRSREVTYVTSQDSYVHEASLEGRTASAISKELGSFTPEIIQIELGSWSKQDSRKLAQKNGIGNLDRLIFTPGSSDVHGSWLSLKHSNLCICARALHRFHRLPALSEPPAYLNAMIAAQDLFEACVTTGVETLGFPVLDPPSCLPFSFPLPFPWSKRLESPRSC